MSLEELDRRYLNWLVDQVADVKKRKRTLTHWSLFEQLHETIFVAIVSHDENRIADAKDLKYEFLSEHEGERGDLDWMRSPCSMFELLIILSRQLGFETDDEPYIWFWHLIDELDLERYDDHNYNSRSRKAVGAILDRVIWRTYEPSGKGGFFPLRHSERDQRDVELWYQLNAYLLENF